MWASASFTQEMSGILTLADLPAEIPFGITFQSLFAESHGVQELVHLTTIEAPEMDIIKPGID